MTRLVRATGGVLVILSAALGVVWPVGRETLPTGSAFRAAPADEQPAVTWTEAQRASAMRRASVWRPVDSSRIDLGANPPDPSGLLSHAIVRCRFQPRPIRGTAPKFDCVLGDGEVVKVKYGGSGEGRAELAASRLLTAIGFGTDRMYLVPRLRCYGCPRFPFQTIWMLEHIGLRDLVSQHLPSTRYTDFGWVAVERHFEGTAIDAPEGGGWAWSELASIDPQIGATRAQLDAFRLAAMLLAHWDNKRANQRLVCETPLDGSGTCGAPFAIVQDLGSTFGPKRIDLRRWAATPIWADQAHCLVSMRQLPYSGATFPDAEIGEAGRRLIADHLSALSASQIQALFTSSRFGNPLAWTAALQEKIRQITSGGPCRF